MAAIVLSVANLLFWCVPFFLVIPLKFIPLDSTRKAAQRALNAIGECWIWANTALGRLLYGLEFTAEGLENPEIRPDRSYIVICNHQSFTDIYVLQAVFNRRMPLLRFFIKSTLIYFPVLGATWWGLDFPFVKRHSSAEIKKRPELKGRDLRNIVEVCARYRHNPTALLNFLEGHRRTPQRMASMKGPGSYSHLLRPHAGGVSVALTAMRESLCGVLDVTIAYPGDRAAFKDLFMGRLKKARVAVEFIPISDVPMEADIDSAPASERVRNWVNDRWAKKDALLERMIGEFDRD
jgi:1-acyl-sn-glycerol-3-phosphate acyltransferase